MTVRGAILGLLYQKSRHAYDLYASFHDLIGINQHWDVKPAQVYTTLERLQASGLVSVDKNDTSTDSERSIYNLTPTGRQVLQDWLTSPTPSTYLRDEFYIKLIISIASEAADVYQLVTNQRASLRSEMQEVIAMRNEVDSQSNLAYFLLLDHTLTHLEADLHWLDKLEVWLGKIRNQPIHRYQSRSRGRPTKKPVE